MRWSPAAVALLAVAGVLAGCADPVLPPQPVGRIDGAVLDEVMTPYANLTVHLLNLDRTDTTSAGGGFTFREVPPGTYTLAAQAPGTSADVEVVEVRAGEVTRIILQPLRQPSPEPFVTSLKSRAATDLALPDSECTSCAWSSYVAERPHEMAVRAAWGQLGGRQDELTLSVVGPAGNVIASATGTSPLDLLVPGDRLVEGSARYGYQVRFPAGFTPQPFEMEMLVHLYYGAGRDAQAAGSVS
jgi:hypothetical protein